MATQLQIRRGTTAQMNAFTGAEGELAVNTTTDTVHVHDGSTAGGFALAKADGSNIGTYAGSFTTLAASGAVTLSSTLAVTGALTVDTNTLVVDATNNRVGIGITPATLLDIKESTAATDAIIGLTAGTGGRAQIRSEAQADNTSSELSFYTMSGSNTSEVMRISGSNVGIGTSSPSSFNYLSTSPHLVVGGGSSDTGVTCYSSTNGYGRLAFADGTGSTEQYRGLIQYYHADNSMQFYTGSDERMRLSGGNLLVGTTDDAAGAGNTNAGVSIRGGSDNRSFFSVNSNYVMHLNRNTNDGSILEFARSGANVGSILSSGGDGIIIQGVAAGSGLLLHNSNAILPAQNGNAVDATIDLGRSSPSTFRFKDLYLSGVANVGSIVQTGSSSSLIANFTNTNTSGFGMRITTYSSGAQYGFAVDSYGGGYSRDFVIGVDGYIYSLPTYGLTTGGSANMFVATDGSFQRSVSSARYKNTITDATHGLTELLTLRPVTYKGNNDADTVFGGLIAEEVHDAGLTEFVQYNEEDQPDALAYGNMVSLCIKAIQELKEELNTATARITELENN